MNRFESVLAILATLVIFASTMLDPVVTISLFIVLILIYATSRPWKQDNRFQPR
ncbi:MAG: hypothetical protein K8L99_00110 [Anaerolineae bacterium]|nr:hypothetical protein [Anaerolineae bacterium]